ncbi:MAG: hypothetical protein KGQ41_01900 [Alphaproteobacteria bacterium]|nr:hypothetical protein [Alphaproteobacteria bacterium]
MRRLQPEDILRSGQVQSTKAVIAMLQRNGFGKPEFGKGSHLTLTHEDFDDLIVGLVYDTDVLAYQYAAAEACLEARARIEAKASAAASAPAHNLVVRDGLELIERSKKSYVRSKLFPCLGFAFDGNPSQKSFDGAQDRLEARVAKFQEHLELAKKHLEFDYEVADGELLIWHAVYPIDDILPPYGTPNFYISPNSVLMQLLRMCECFDRICNQGMDEAYAKSENMQSAYELKIGTHPKGFKSVTLVPRSKARATSPQMIPITFLQTPGGRVPPSEVRNILEEFVVPLNKGINGLAEAAGWVYREDGTGNLEVTHPYHPDKFTVVSPEKYQMALFELLDAMPNSGNEADYIRFVELSDEHNKKMATCLGNMPMMEALRIMQERCEPQFKALTKQLNELGYTRFESAGTGKHAIVIEFKNTRFKDKPVLHLETIRIPIDRKHSHILFHDKMVSAANDFISGLNNACSNGAGKKAALPGLGTPLKGSAAPFASAADRLVETIKLSVKPQGRTLPPPQLPIPRRT